MEDEFTIEATEADLSLLHKLAVEQIRLENAIEIKEQELKALEKDLKKIEQGLLPDAIQNCGLSEFKTMKGDIVTVKDDMSVSVPKNKQDDIIKWIEEKGHGDIITGSVYVNLPRNSHNERQAAIQALVDAGLEPCESLKVNTATLKSILKARIKRGENIKLEDFGGFAWRKAIIKRV